MTSHTLPMAAAIGGDGIGARVQVNQNAEGVYFLDLYFEEGGQSGGTEVADEAALDARTHIASVVRSIDPTWLRSAVDRTLGSMADDPYLAAAQVIADWIEGNR